MLRPLPRRPWTGCRPSDVFDRIMALLRRRPERDPELDRTRARINAAAVRLSRKLNVSTSEIIDSYRTGDEVLRTGTRE